MFIPLEYLIIIEVVVWLGVLWWVLWLWHGLSQRVAGLEDLLDLYREQLDRKIDGHTLWLQFMDERRIEVETVLRIPQPDLPS